MAPVLIEAPKRAIKFAANEQYTEYYKRLFGMKTVTQPLSILTGISAGVTEAFVVVSMDLVKIRMQDPKNVIFAPLNNSKYLGWLISKYI